MKTTKIAFYLLILLYPFYTYSQFQQSWISNYDGYGLNDNAGKYVIDENGYIYVTGTVNISLGISHIITLKYSPDGILVNSREDQYYYAAAGIAISIYKDIGNNEYIYVTGQSSSGYLSSAIVLIKYDSNLNEVWHSSYGGAGLGTENIPYAIKNDLMGNIFITGSLVNYYDGIDLAIVKFTPNGLVEHVNAYNGTSNSEDIGFDLEIDNFNNIYVVGQSTNIGTLTDMTLIKYDNNLNQLWVNIYDEANGQDFISSLDIDKNRGDLYITGGTSRLYHNPDTELSTYILGITTKKFNTSGDVLWTERYDAGGYGVSIKMNRLLRPPTIYVTGPFNDNPITKNDIVTILYNSENGDRIWSSRYNNNNEDESSYQMNIDRYGNAFILGRIYHNYRYVDNDLITLIYNSIGNLIWENTYTSDGNDEPKDIKTNLSGNMIYCLSTSEYMSTIDDITLIKYVKTQNDEILDKTLFTNFPNPFNPSTTIKYSLIKNGNIKIEVFDIIGRLVSTLVNKFETEGVHEIVFNGINLSSGIYFCKLTTSDRTEIRKIILSK